MNKQKLIDELTKTQEKYYEVWMNLDLDKSSRDTAISIYAGIMLAKTYVDQLDEPKDEKVEVPDFVAEWLKNNNYSSDIYDLFQNVEYATDADGFIPENWKWCEEFYDWISQYSDTFYILSDAIRYGYTVKPKQWVVKFIPPFVDEFRYYSMNDVNFDITESSWTSDKEDAYPFTEKEKAEALALLVDGSVEEV